ncbi:hypothetical protein VVR84_03955 [Kocuria carniphila]|uniref:GerMN domain-containing protein n=1 Tax=Kocuria carniphila TaxID=262208 RepID=A0ABV3V1G1_9MICC
MRVAKYLGTVLLVALAVVLMLFGVGAILDRLDPGEPVSQDQTEGATRQDATATPEVFAAEAPAGNENPNLAPAPATEAPVQQAVVPTPAELNPSEAVHEYLSDEPWYGPQEMGTPIIESVTVEDDDVIVRLVTPFNAGATQNHGLAVLADVTDALRSHLDDPAIQGLDQVAVFSSDEVVVGLDSIVGRPHAAT